ncbi:MAG: hypothetical protein IJI05_03095 [Erysipelotrichaceae bacterium]|nr:hypothetical protein [Erysipelotrichaceae bacterium]
MKQYGDEIIQLQKELTELIVMRDELSFHVAALLDNMYIEYIGYPLFRVNSQKLANQKIARLIELTSTAVREQQLIRMSDLVRKVDSEFRDYSEQIGRQDTILTELPEISAEEKTELVSLYREVLLKVHPLVSQGALEKRRQLFQRAVNYYRNYDLAGLRYIAYLLKDWRDVQDWSDAGKATVEIERLKKEITVQRKRLDSMRRHHPFNKLDLLNDTEALNARKHELEIELADLREQFEYYNDRLLELSS